VQVATPISAPTLDSRRPNEAREAVRGCRLQPRQLIDLRQTLLSSRKSATLGFGPRARERQKGGDKSANGQGSSSSWLGGDCGPGCRGEGREEASPAELRLAFAEGPTPTGSRRHLLGALRAHSHTHRGCCPRRSRTRPSPLESSSRPASPISRPVI
jgi:hypothetical protein